MDGDRMAIRGISAALGLALVGFGAWKSYAEFRAKREMKRAEARLAFGADFARRVEVQADSLCRRRGVADSLEHRDGIAWAAAGIAAPIRARGREDDWDWACFGTPDSGLVVFLALDTGCATSHSAGLWSHSCRTVVQAWDLEFRRGEPASISTSARSLWSFPGSSRVCPARDRTGPPVDSVVQERCAASPGPS